MIFPHLNHNLEVSTPFRPICSGETQVQPPAPQCTVLQEEPSKNSLQESKCQFVSICPMLSQNQSLGKLLGNSIPPFLSTFRTWLTPRPGEHSTLGRPWLENVVTQTKNSDFWSVFDITSHPSGPSERIELLEAKSQCPGISWDIPHLTKPPGNILWSSAWSMVS